MKTIEIKSDEELNVKRWYFNPVIFKTKCPECGDSIDSYNDMIEYPEEGTSIYFECEKCKTQFSLPLIFVSSRSTCVFSILDDMEVIDNK